MPVHNGMPYLEKSLRSILSQSFADFEFVVGDDGSDDGSSGLLRKAAAQDPRIRLLRRDRKSGPAASVDWVTREARGELIAMANADDLSRRDRLAREVEVFRGAPDAVLVGSMCDCIDKPGRRVRSTALWRLTSNSPLAPFAHSSVMFRREAFLAAGGYRAAAEYWEDLDLYWRLGRLGRILVIPETLVSVRLSESSTRLRDSERRVSEAVDLAYRSVDACARGEDYDEVVRRGRRPGARLDPRVFIARGSIRLWSGHSPRVLRQLLRQGDLRFDVSSAQALVWALWGEVSPRSLRLFIRGLNHIRNLAAQPRIAGRSAVEWRPRRARKPPRPAFAARLTRLAGRIVRRRRTP